jgi:molybdopterin converting factor small subunit
MSDIEPVHVRLLAALHGYQRARGRPTAGDVKVPRAGITARDLAERLELPAELVEGVFLNYAIAGLDAMVRPGDRVAFVPPGTPASHPAFFGPFVTRPR